MTCGSSKSGSDTHRHLKTLQSTFRALKKKKKGKRYNESHCKQLVQEIFEELKYLTTSETDSVFNFEVISKEDLRYLSNCRDRNVKLQTELDNEKEEKERNKIRLKETIQHEKQKVTKGEEENSNLRLQIAKLKEGQKDLENENEKLRETIQLENYKVIQGEEEIASLRGQVEKLKEIQNVLEKEKEKMQTELTEKEETEKMLGMECLRLQETLDQVRRQGEEEVRNLKVHLEELEEDRKDLENKLRRYQEDVEELNKDLKSAKRTNNKQETDLRNLLQKKEILEGHVESLKYRVAEANSKIDQLNRQLTEERKAKENALNRLSAAAANRLRDQNPGITDLSDPNRPLKLAEKVSELYDNEWTNAIENLEAIDVSEEKGIRILLKIIQNVFDTCSEFGDVHLQSFPDLLVLPPTIFQLGKSRMINIEKMSSDVLKPMKDFRKSNAKYAITCLQEYFSKKEGKSRMQIEDKYLEQCREYIEKCVELCWMMRVQDPPIYMEANYATNSPFDSSRMRSFTKAGQFIHFVVWPTFFLHKDGPLLAKGVVQGSKTKIPEEKPGSSSSDEESHSSSDESDDEKYKDARSRTGSEPATEKDKDGAQDTSEISPNANDNEPLASTVESSNGSNEKGDNDSATPQNDDIKGRDTENKAAVDGSSPNEEVAQSGDENGEENTNIPSLEQQNETPEDTPENRNQLGQMKAAGDTVETSFSHVPYADNVSTDQSDENTDDEDSHGETEETRPEGNDAENPEKAVPSNQETDV
uniref:Structural maintenance of chromosomes protein 2-like isoform X3 n=1 Tax=Crassostrea virginica TaxID=6565 RepID=A0A8B8DGR8_CRAVI|nr:structural maintenance of chromosomes protein 2-like isoform X3 [Crassostrea virginica]